MCNNSVQNLLNDFQTKPVLYENPDMVHSRVNQGHLIGIREGDCRKMGGDGQEDANVSESFLCEITLVAYLSSNNRLAAHTILRQ
jgi:hypothetical protein